MKAKQLALALRQMAYGFVGDRKALVEAIAFLEEQAQREDQKALALATIDEWEKWGKQDSAGTILRVKAALTNG